MEAFAALGIACNILQLISCGLHVASVSKQIYEKGSTDRNDEVSEHAKQMTLITASLNSRLIALSNQGNLSREQQELQKLAVSCQDVSAKLQHEIDRLGGNGQRRRWRAITASLKTIMHQNTIDGLEKKLREHRSLLQTQLLADLHVKQEAMLFQQSQQYSKMDQSFQILVDKVATGSTKLSDLVLDMNFDLTKAIQTEGRDVRDHITSHMQNLEVQVAQRRQREKLELSLQYPEMNERISSLTEAHKNTFEWLFNKKKRGTWSSFTDWLEKDDGIYWISGKPGAGKSVLMKFLFHHQKTMKHLAEWAKTKPVLKIHFFIWKAGHTLQRRRKGLLTSVVRQLIQENETFAIEVLNRKNIATKKEIADWSVSELSDMLKLFTEIRIASLCIFVDGLDETDHTDGDVGMLKLIHWLCGLDGVKICAASRPEPEFRIALAGYPQLILQDLTSDDLRKFSYDQLKEIGQQQFLDEDDPSSVPERLLKLVLSKADGVFLWVRLAIANITRGLQRMDGWEELMKRLDQLPSELEELYIDMWQRNRSDHQNCREEAARYFEIILGQRNYTVSSFEIMVAYGNHAKTLLENPDSKVSRAQLRQECKRLEQRVLACSLGLLEIQPLLRPPRTEFSRGGVEILDLQDEDTAAELHAYRTRMIRFIHRTAIEFLRETIAGQNIIQRGSSTFENRSKVRLDTYIVAAFCEFPIVNLVELETLCHEIAMTEISDTNKVHYATVFDRIQRNLMSTSEQNEHLDVCRNWIDSALTGQWECDHPWLALEVPFVGPLMYALGWPSLVAAAGILPYFEQMLSEPSDNTVNQDYASCLAMCAAAVSAGEHAMSIKLINLAIRCGADINSKFPRHFHRTPYMDPLSEFCQFDPVTKVPDCGDLETILHELELACLKLNDDSKPTVRWFVFDYLFEDDAKVAARVWNQLADVHPVGFDRKCLVEINFSALLRSYCQFIGASDMQIQRLLKGRSPPRYALLGINLPSQPANRRKRNMEIRCPLTKEDSDRFFAQLDKCCTLDAFVVSRTPVEESRRAENEQANRELLELIQDIYDRGTATTYDDLMTSTGYFPLEVVTHADIPFLTPFGDTKSDVSKLIRRG